MQSTSDTFKNSIYAPVRRTAGRVTFDISDQTAASDVSSITTTSESPLSVKDQLVNKVRTPTFKIATNEKDRFKLDGSFSFPDDTIANNGELGWSSASICDSSGNFEMTGITNFLGKVSGSTVENANTMGYRINSTTLMTPSNYSEEMNQTRYNSVSVLDGTTEAQTFTGVGYIGQRLFKFNLIEYVIRKHGVDVFGSAVTTADRVAFLRTKATRIDCNWWGYGNSPTGSKASLTFWTGSAWTTPIQHLFGSVTMLNKFMIGSIPTSIDDNGFVHFLAYADASNGTIASTINTDYVELQVVLNLQPSFTFNFNSNHSSAGLTITFDQSTGEYATDFDMTAYDVSNAVIDSVSVVGNTDVVSTPLGQLLNYRKVSVTIKKWSVPNRRARVFEVDFGVVRQYGDDGLINMSLTEEFDMMTSKLPSPELKFTVDNVDRAFNILNPTGFYKYLQQKQQIIAEIGLELPDGSFEYVQLGQYLLQNWQSNEGSITATFTARTNLDSMASFDYEGSYVYNQSLYNYAVAIFGYCGISNYYIDPALQLINTNSLNKKMNCRDILQMIAIAGCANIYVTRDNVITLKCNRTRKVRYIRDWSNNNSVAVGNHWVEIKAFDLSGVNQALGKNVTPSNVGFANSPSLVTDGDTSAATWYGSGVTGLQYVTVDLGSSIDIASVAVWHYHLDGRTFYGTKTEISEDGVTWSTVFDSAISGTYAETSTGRTYSMETVMTPLAPVDTADFDNMFEEPRVTLDEAIKRVEVTYWSNLSTSAIVGVNSTTDTLGDTLKLENNTLINDSTRATAVANWLLAQIKYKARYAINWRGNPAIELNDVMAFENSYGADTSAYITRIELDYAGYLTARMQAKGAVT